MTAPPDLTSGALGGGDTRLDVALEKVGRALAEAALKSALKPVRASLKGGFESLIKNALSGGEGVPAALFAKGRAVAAPSYFPSGRALASVGEQDGEAVRSRARGPKGRRSERPGGAFGQSMNVTVNVAPASADVFRRSEAQVAAALARAVARGQRGL